MCPNSHIYQLTTASNLSGIMLPIVFFKELQACYNGFGCTGCSNPGRLLDLCGPFSLDLCCMNAPVLQKHWLQSMSERSKNYLHAKSR